MSEIIEDMINDNYYTLDIKIDNIGALIYKIQIYFTYYIKINFEIKMDKNHDIDYNLHLIRNKINNLILNNFMKGY